MMIDHLMKFADEASAKADAVVGAYYLAGEDGAPGSWHGDVCIPGVQVWQPAQDVTTTDDLGNTIITHQFLPYWYLIVAAREVVPALRDHEACMLVADRDAASRGEPRFVLQTVIPAEQLGGYMLQPTFAGSNYPFG